MISANQDNCENEQVDQICTQTSSTQSIRIQTLIDKWTNQPFYSFTDTQIIGKGGFGRVYKGFSNYHSKFVAIKRQPKYTLNFSREVLNLIQLNQYHHPNIIKLLGFQYEVSLNSSRMTESVEWTPNKIKTMSQKKFQKNFQNDIFFQNIILQLCQTSLESFIYRRSFEQFRTDKMIRKIVVGILQGLFFLEEMNFAHRDLKPQNILLTRYFQVKLNDFGSGKIIDQTDTKQYNCLNITPMVYRAPELCIGVNNYSTKLDIWSAGCIFAEFLIQDILFDIDKEGQQLYEFNKIIGYPVEQDFEYLKNKMGKFFSIFPKQEKNMAKHQMSKAITFEEYSSKQLPLEYTSPLMKNILRRINWDECGMSKEAIFDLIILIERMLVLNPQNRISAKEALEFRFCKGAIDNSSRMPDRMYRNKEQEYEYSEEETLSIE